MSLGLATCNLQGRQLLNCPVEVLLRSTVLTSLNLNRNKIVTLPRNISVLSILVSLDLDCNQLEQVPHEIGYIHTLQHLSIKNNVLISLPRSFGLLTAIKSLYLSCNNLTTIPPELFVNLPRIEVFSKPNPGQQYSTPRLQQLWLNTNLLMEVPQQALSSALTDLRLDHNRIRAFPNFEALGSLRSLQMQHNQIVAFEQSMTALVNLTTMDLGQNAIKIVPDYIATLPALATCNLEGNPIEQLATSMTFTLTRFNLRSASEMVTESWRHQEQLAVARHNSCTGKPTVACLKKRIFFKMSSYLGI